jgi:hypothetical protein
VRVAIAMVFLEICFMGVSFELQAGDYGAKREAL